MIIDSTFARRIAENLNHAHLLEQRDDENTKIISDALDTHANWATEAMRVKQERLDKECSALHKELANANALLKESRKFTDEAHGREYDLKQTLIELGQMRPQLNAVAMMTRNVTKIPGESVSDA